MPDFALTNDSRSALISFFMAIAITGGLYLLLSRTDVGRAMRATAQEEADGLDLAQHGQQGWDFR